MKSKYAWIALLLAGLLVTPAFAGAKCSASTQECLNMMAKKFKNRGWVGLEYERDATGALLVKRIVDGSPAQGAGLRAGDKLIGVNGVKFSEADEEALHKALGDWTPGKKIVYLVDRNGAEKNIEIILAKPPEEVIAQWIGMHMLEAHVTTNTAQK
jgi:S1-C subfamily serine protease